MKKKISISILISAILLVMVASTVFAGGNFRGEDVDSEAPALGVIKYLGNPAGYHFWFTANADLGPYLAGHSYHNVYKIKEGDKSEWCGPVNIPDRPPYNEVGHTGSAFYKIWDTTTDTLVCP